MKVNPSVKPPNNSFNSDRLFRCRSKAGRLSLALTTRAKHAMWWQSEEEVLKRIATNKMCLANCVSFALETAFPYPESRFANDILISTNVPRTGLGLEPERKPGDIDVLIIPFHDSEYYFERSIAIEVKVLRPSIARPSRNVNSMGIKQVSGLLRDGFPFVGLLHIAVPEKSPAELWWNVPMIAGTLKPSGEVVETGEHVFIDPLPIITAERQEGRIAAAGLPIESGFCSIGLNLSLDYESFSGGTTGFDKPGMPNPQRSQKLLAAIERCLNIHRGNFSEVQWFGKSRS